jgi:hydrogenase expression/formation protein HypD
MKYLSEFHNPESVLSFSKAIHKITSRSWTLMEVCGGQTHSIIKNGLDQLLPKQINLLHGPGCPVCVTPGDIIDQGIAIAMQSHVIFCTFGDMMRVPGHSGRDLFYAKSQGADVRVIYSPLDAVAIAAKELKKEVVLFAVGFETTAPAHALAVYQASKSGLINFSMLSSHVLVPPALISILEAPSGSPCVNGFLAAGHVCTVMGAKEYDEPIVKKYKVPIVITGFEPLDIMQGLFMLIQQLEQGVYKLENQYSRVAKAEGNRAAQEMILRVFKTIDKEWRGLGQIQKSGLELQPEFSDFDANQKFSYLSFEKFQSPNCLSGEILIGKKKPHDCPAFGKTCNPQNPLGATMVSTEGACAAYYNYRRESND